MSPSRTADFLTNIPLTFISSKTLEAAIGLLHVPSVSKFELICVPSRQSFSQLVGRMEEQEHIHMRLLPRWVFIMA